GILDLFNTFSGGSLERMSLIALGVMPYITDSIVVQLAASLHPALAALKKEGATGRQKINQYTRILTVPLALLQGIGVAVFMNRSGVLPAFGPEDWAATISILATFVAGTLVLMWLGELITQRGVGNGMSLIITISIISQFPFVFGQIYTQTAQIGRWTQFIVIVAIFLSMIAAIIYVDQGQRRIPIQFAKRVRGRRVMGGQSTYIPLKVNTAGVIPVIFATSVLLIPSLMITAIPSDAAWVQTVFRWINENMGAGVQGVTWWYIFILFALIVFFTYFYTAIQFDPTQQAEMIQRQGGFIPGVRPGRQTERHLAHILNRITLPGSIFLATISVLPAIAGAVWNIQIAFSGVSILIVVGVALETMKQIESQLTMRNYEGILT
ncbi:MAG: preprotein translocase subunit SecY, partial [Actinobacteria bacterium]|nr:preprotein translocase subunit SecY [Actinomycetota bacterium]